jgi:hypothetical protein
LTSHNYRNADKVEKPSDQDREIAVIDVKGAASENDEVRRLSNEASQNVDEAKSGEKLVDDRSIANVGTVTFVPDDAVEKKWAKEDDERLPNDRNVFDYVPLVKSVEIMPLIVSFSQIFHSFIYFKVNFNLSRKLEFVLKLIFFKFFRIQKIKRVEQLNSIHFPN